MARSDLTSARLELVPLTPAFLSASLADAGAGNRKALEAMLWASVPAEWLAERKLTELRLGQLTADPALQPWLLRAMVTREERQMVGFIGFHGAPGAAELAAHAPGGVELGFSVFPAHRRKGYAAESCTAMIDWAHRMHGVDRFVVSIGPDNDPSLALARRLGFTHVGEQVDPEDGRELIFLLTRTEA